MNIYSFNITPLAHASGGAFVNNKLVAITLAGTTYFISSAQEVYVCVVCVMYVLCRCGWATSVPRQRSSRRPVAARVINYLSSGNNTRTFSTYLKITKGK